MTDTQKVMLKKMLGWNQEYLYRYFHFDNIFDIKTLKKEMRGLISGGYVKLCRGGINDDGEVMGGTGFCLDYERLDEIKKLTKKD